MTAKRRGYSPDDLRRRGPQREPYNRVLIVCEGAKTEPNYFSELCDFYRLSSANVKVTPGEGNDPVSIVRTAKQRQQAETRQGERYDRIYCVFDRDEHTNYADGCHQAEVAGYCCIPSVPCFEYWLLLHFGNSRAPFSRTGIRTAAQNCEHALKTYMPDYQKGKKGLFQKLFPHLPAASERATRVIADAQRTGEDNPSTRVHELVDYLQRLKD